MYSGRKKKFNKFERKIEAEIDLHGFLLSEAHYEFLQFLKFSLDSNYKRVKVITGKGLHSENGVGKIKAMVIDILKLQKFKFQEAKLNEGGEGAIIIDF